jgi:hypothetical protein
LAFSSARHPAEPLRKAGVKASFDAGTLATVPPRFAVPASARRNAGERLDFVLPVQFNIRKRHLTSCVARK